MYLQTYNPTDPFYTKESLIQHVYTKKVYLYNMSEKKGTHQASKKYKQLPSTQEIGNTHYST